MESSGQLQASTSLPPAETSPAPIRWKAEWDPPKNWTLPSLSSLQDSLYTAQTVGHDENGLSARLDTGDNGKL
jgi:hypothetical protein